MKVEDLIYSALPVDEIIRQSPPLEDDREIRAVRPCRAQSGDLEGNGSQLENRASAPLKVELLQSGMQIGEISDVYLQSSRNNLGTEQIPPGTSDVTTRTKISSFPWDSRPVAYVMPNLKGWRMNDAVSETQFRRTQGRKDFEFPALPRQQCRWFRRLP